MYGAIRGLDFEPVVARQLGPIQREQFDEWHSAALILLGEIEPKLRGQIGWAAKIINVYLKTYAYVGGGGRPNLPDVLHPPIDQGLWRGRGE